MSLLLALTGASGTSYNLACDAGSYSVSGQDATLTRAVVLDCAAGSYSVTGQSATFAVALSLDCLAGSYVVSGQAVSFVLSTGGRSKLYNPYSVDYWAWPRDTPKPKAEEVKPEIELAPEVEAEAEEEYEIVNHAEDSIEPILSDIKTLESQLAAINIQSEKLKSYDKMFKLEEELRIEKERINQEEEDFAIALCIAMLLD